MVGSTILHYKILEKLGEGGMGEVYKAKDTKLHRTVALKFLPSQLMRDDETRKRFINEARAASALDHPNIGTIFEINENIETPFISMAYYGGKTLKQKIAEGKIDIEQATQIAIKIASGLKKANSKDIIHRDIKPANIIFTDDDEELKIIDFGLAKLMVNTVLTQTGTVMGTLSYMSPEQLKGVKVDHRTDIWSLGVVLYEMLTAKCPFQGDFDQAVMYEIINEEPEFITKIRSDVPLYLEKIINKALSKDPEKRYNSMDEMEEALQVALDEYRSGKTTTSFIHKLGRKQLRIVKRISLVFLFIAAITTYWWFNSNVTSKPVSIAILPLENISNNSDQELFAYGMTDALITNMARISGLKIISMSSVMKFKKTDKTASEIAQALGVSYICESSFLKINDQIKINARLIDASNNEYLWAQEYKRDFTDILSLEDDVAQAITRQIKVKLTPYEQTLLSDRHKVNPGAYESYLKGRFYAYKETPEALDLALKYFEMAVKLDSQYAPGYTGIGIVYGSKAQMGYESYQSSIKKEKLYITKALQLDSTIADVHSAMAAMYCWGDWEWNKSLEEYKKTIKLNPNDAAARANYSQTLFIIHHPEEGMKQIEQALELDPYNTFFKAFYGMDLMYAHRYDDVINMLKDIHQDPIALSTLRSAYHQKHMYKEALEIWRQSFELLKDYEAIKALNQGNKEGGYSVALQQVAELKVKRSKTKFVTPWQIATLYTRAGMKDEALKWFEKAYEAHDPNMPYLNCDPVFDELRSDPRFQNLIKKMGLPI